MLSCAPLSALRMCRAWSPWPQLETGVVYEGVFGMGDWVSGAIDPVDCQQFGFYPSAEDPRGDRRSSRQGPARRG